jgi:hypothetical protein
MDMKRFSILTLLLVSILILSACGTGPTPPPTFNPVDLQNTAAAVAFTIVAATGSAVPTLTPAPTETATNTPAPTNTFLPLPSSAEPSTPTAGVEDACEDQVLPGALEGKTVKLRINNSTKVTVNVSVYLNRTIPPVVCGYRAYVVEPGSSVVINDLVEGCFTIWAWNPDPKEYFMVTNGAASCIDSSYPAAFDISTRDIRQR